MKRDLYERVGRLVRPLSAGDGDPDCPAWENEPWLHYAHRLAQHLGLIPPGPNPHADELEEFRKKESP